MSAGPVLEGKARAKINLDLRVFEKRPDGYHTVKTLLARIGLHDTITVTEADRTGGIDGIHLTVHGDAGGAAGPENLAYKAASALRKAAGFEERGLAIELTKRIPTGAGLGGGSADAGTTLRLVNELWGAPIGEDALIRLGGTLGADIPFLTADLPAAFGKKRGDELEPVALPDGGAVLLALPSVHVGTAEAYAGLAQYRQETGWSGAVGMSPLELSRWAFLATACVNHFEAPVHAMFPELVEIHHSLTETDSLFARMSGSGAAHFAVFPDAERADDALDGLRERHPRVHFLVTPFE